MYTIHHQPWFKWPYTLNIIEVDSDEPIDCDLMKRIHKTAGVNVVHYIHVSTKQDVSAALHSCNTLSGLFSK